MTLVQATAHNCSLLDKMNKNNYLITIIITKVTPVITGATGRISKSFRKYLSSVPGKHGIKELQQTAILGTAHTLREVLM
jgi:hypothetical protein